MIAPAAIGKLRFCCFVLPPSMRLRLSEAEKEGQIDQDEGQRILYPLAK